MSLITGFPSTIFLRIFDSYNLTKGAKKLLLVFISFLLWPVSTVIAAPAYWANWTSNTSSEVSGTLTVGSSIIDVTFSGAYGFSQTSGGTNYWNPPTPYISPLVDNAPPSSDIIGLGSGGSATIKFSEVIQDPILALVSWNGNIVDFGVPIEILSYGAGYWGDGIPILNSSGTGFYGNGEVHGVIRLPGSYSSITFTHTSEYWHGLTVGVLDVAPFFGGSLKTLPSYEFSLEKSTQKTDSIQL